MAIYRLWDSARDKPEPRRVFDANGNEILRCVECDTETGRVVRYVLDKSGSLIHTIGNAAQTEEVFRPAPLQVVFNNEVR